MKMNRRQGAALFLAVVCIFTPVITAADSLASVKSAILEKWDQYDSMTGVLSATIDFSSIPEYSDLRPANGVGTVSYLRQYEKVFSRCEINFPMDPKKTQKPHVLWIISDKDEYMEVVFLGKVFRAGKLEGRGKAFAAGGKALFDFMQENFNLTVLPEDTVNNEPVYAIQGKLKNPEFLAGSDKFLFYFSQETGVLLKLVSYGKGIEKPVAIITTGNIKFNEPLTPDQFNYVPPESEEPEENGQVTPDTNDTQQAAPELAPAPAVPQAPENEAAEKKDPEPVVPEVVIPDDPLDPGPGIKPAPEPKKQEAPEKTPASTGTADPDKKDAAAPKKDDEAATPSKE